MLGVALCAFGLSCIWLEGEYVGIPLFALGAAFFLM